MWKSELDLHIRTYSPHHIDAVVNPRIDDAWRFTGFYGASKIVNWEDSWSLLRYLSTQIDCRGSILGISMKLQDWRRSVGELFGLRNRCKISMIALIFCGFKDLGFTGLPFTSCNRRYEGLLVWVRLDRAVNLVDWLIKFPSIRLHHLTSFSSDHKPIWLCSNNVHSRFHYPQKPSRFEAIWLKDEQCEGVVHSA